MQKSPKLSKSGEQNLPWCYVGESCQIVMVIDSAVLLYNADHMHREFLGHKAAH